MPRAPEAVDAARAGLAPERNGARVLGLRPLDVTEGSPVGRVEAIRIDGEAPDFETVDRAVSALGAGGLLIFPTDTLYALGGLALDRAAVRRVREAKGRDDAKPLPLVVADVAQAQSIARHWSSAARLLAAHFWPGPLTLVLPAAAHVPDEVTAGTGTVAVRVPALELTRLLCRLAGPLTSTSANRAGRPAPETCQAALAEFPSFAGLALDAGPGRAHPSTIVDTTGGVVRLVRLGAVPWSDVEAVVGT